MTRDIRIDWDADYRFGSDQAYVSCPLRFPTVTFTLILTDGLVTKFGRDDLAESHIGINGYTPSGTDTVLDAETENGESIRIDLSDTEQADIWEALDEQCRAHLGRGCRALLDEAEAEM